MASLPDYLKASLMTSTEVDSVIDSAPDIVMCNADGYVYEVKGEKIINSLYLKETGKEICYAHIVEKKKPLLVYIILSSKNKLFVIKRIDSRLKVSNIFENVAQFEVDDFKLFGHPQIKIKNTDNKTLYHYFVNDNKTTLNEFNCNKDFQFSAKSLEEKLQIICRHVDELTEEWYKIRELCHHIDKGNVAVNADCCNFSLPLVNFPVKISVTATWFKVIGQKLVYGLIICNDGKKVISDLQFKVDGKAITEYTYRLFLHNNSSGSEENPLLSSEKIISSIQPMQKISVVVSASVDFLNFPFNTNLQLLCYLTSAKFKGYILKETFEVSTLGMVDACNKFFPSLKDACSVKDLQAIKTAKTETKIKIQTKNTKPEHFESVLEQNLMFVKVNTNGFKLYYCISNLMEVIIAFHSFMMCENFWNINLYTSQESHIYFFLDTLRILLPEYTIFLNED